MINVSGLEALEKIKAYNPVIPVIIMTAFASVETAVEALKIGAYDYLTKPLDFDELKIVMQRAMEHAYLKKENRTLKATLAGRFDRRSIIGRSAVMTSLLDTVSHIAASDATVLISGESGTGKEVIAAAIHFNSPRREGPFVRINCAAITETLLESELFGHERGAFTGARPSAGRQVPPGRWGNPVSGRSQRNVAGDAGEAVAGTPGKGNHPGRGGPGHPGGRPRSLRRRTRTSSGKPERAVFGRISSIG